MAKIVLGKRPESFKATVSFDMLDGSKGVIEVDYVYRTKTEFGELVDKLAADALASAKAADAANVPVEGSDEPAAAFGMGDLQKMTKTQTARFLLAIVKGWNLDVEFNEDNVLQLCDELPAAASALTERYRAACVEGRTKN